MYTEFLKYQHRVDQRASALAGEMVEELEAVHERVMGKLSSLLSRARKSDTVDLPTLRRVKLLETQIRNIEEILDDLYSTFGESLQTAGLETLQATSIISTRLYNQLFNTGFQPMTFTKAMLVEWWTGTTIDNLIISEWMQKLQRNTRDRIISASRQALIQGMGMEEAARHMRRNGIEGSIPGTENLARTVLMSASNYSKERVAEETFGDFISRWRHIATLDDRTCLRCGALDGKEYGKDEIRPQLPLHWRCRCTYIPLPPTWKELGIDLEEVVSERAAVKHTTRTVHHRDGSTSTKFTPDDVKLVSGKTTYTQWLKSQLEQDPAFVKDVLGPKRFELFKSGKLDLKAMATSGRIKSLEELT